MGSFDQVESSYVNQAVTDPAVDSVYLPAHVNEDEGCARGCLTRGTSCSDVTAAGSLTVGKSVHVLVAVLKGWREDYFSNDPFLGN